MDKTRYEFVALPVGTPTKNGNVYPKEVLEKAISKYKKNYIDENRSIVTLYSDGCKVNLNDSVAIVKDLRIGVHDQLLVKVELLNTVSMKTLLSENGKFDFKKFIVAPFGIATVKDNVIQDDYEIIGFHIISDYEERNKY